MSKVIFKMTFKHPNFKDTVSKNVSHVGYIATRSGVDKTLTESDLKKELEKGLENLSSENQEYVKYIDERPRSHGLFGQNGLEDPKDIQEEISNVSGYVWRGIVSLKEDDAKEIGYLEKQQWQDMLRKKLPDMANEMGIKTTNLRWVAAVHMEKGHPHAHLMVWEKEPERTLGVVKGKTLENIRKLFTDEIFEQERLQLLTEKDLMRELLKDLAKDDVSQASKLIREVRETGEELKMFLHEMNIEGVMPRLYSQEQAKLSEMLQNLADKMPGKGRVALKFMPQDVKDQVREIATHLLEQPEFTASLERNLNAVEKLTRLYTSEEPALKARENQYLFIVNNIANSLVKYGVDNENVINILRAWDSKQGDNVDLPIERRNSVLDNFKFEVIKEISPREKGIFENISMKIIQDSGNSNALEINRKFLEEKIKELKLKSDGLNDDAEVEKKYAEGVIQNINTARTSYKDIKEIFNIKDILDPITKARDNAYNDIVNRVSQVILKGAAESQRENIFEVNKELANKAVDFIKSMTNKINTIPEQTKVLNEITAVLVKTGHADEQILDKISSYGKSQNIDFREESIKIAINIMREGNGINKNINLLPSRKNIEHYLSIFKTIGYTEKEAFNLVSTVIKSDKLELEERLTKLKEQGLLKNKYGFYELTNAGIDELLKVKDLDKSEKEILKSLESDKEEVKKLSFKELINNKNIFGSLYDKDPEELKIGKFDTKVREEFGESGKITLNELEANIYEKYTDDNLNINTEKAEQEFDILKNRIEKLTLSGYIEFNKETGVHSFTEESKAFFTFDEKKNIYKLSDLAIIEFDIPKGMEFTRYDANITLSYIDKTEHGNLNLNQLRETLFNEITNKTAEGYFERFNEILSSEQNKIRKFISVEENGNIKGTEEGKWLSIGLSKLNKYFREAKGDLTDDKLKSLCGTNQEYEDILKRLNKQMESGHIEKDLKTGAYKINSTIDDINKLLYQIHKEGGVINKYELKDVLEKNIPNYEAEKQFKYLTWRLNNLKQQGYLEGPENEYEITEKGADKREDILTPEREILSKTLSYLKRLGLVSFSEGKYEVTNNYYKYMKNVAECKLEGKERVSELITKDIASVIDKTQDKLNTGKLERSNERIAKGLYINDEYKEMETDYSSVRSYCNVDDTKHKTLQQLSKMLLVSGEDLQSTKEIIKDWNMRTESEIEEEEIEEIVEEVFETVEENNIWGNVTVISQKDWKETFESMGFNEKEMPEWIYKGEYWQRIGIGSLINDIWKSAWRELEKQRMQTEAQADIMKKQISKQQAVSQSKQAMKEQIKKSKDRGSLYHEEDFEM